MKSGPEFYDDERNFDVYNAHRNRPNSPNNLLEKPILMELIGDVQGFDMLDLGCGEAEIAADLLAKGAQSYTGIEPAEKMVRLAQEKNPQCRIELGTMEAWDYPSHAYDLVISRLALHYVDDFQGVFAKVHQSLKPNGRFVFSVLHPVITSSNRAARADGIRLDWIVDDYFVAGKRDVVWLGSEVVQYHRSIEDYFVGLQAAGFTIEALRESRPRPELFEDAELLARRNRIPLFLFFAARRND
jgi:SAM-dependent methyltransferase